jgi:hypothetical protein
MLFSHMLVEQLPSILEPTVLLAVAVSRSCKPHHLSLQFRSTVSQARTTALHLAHCLPTAPSS